MHGTSARLLRLQAAVVTSGAQAMRAGLRVRSHGSATTSNNSSTAPMPTVDDMSSWTTLPWQGNLKNMDTQPTLQELHGLLQAATASIRTYQQAKPRVQNLNKLANRIRRDLLFIEQLLAQQSIPSDQLEQPLQEANSAPGGLGDGQLQGIVNNLRGFHGELLALHEAPGVIAVCQKVSSAPPRIWAPACSISQQPAVQSASKQPTTAAETDADTAAAITTEHQKGRELHGGKRAGRAQSASHPADSTQSNVGGPTWSGTISNPDNDSSKHMQRQYNSNGTDTRGSRTYTLPQTADIGNSNRRVVPGVAAADAAGAAGPVWVEVDVIANDGLTWIEVKNQERFGLESVHWLGCPGRCKGLAQQVADLKAVAAAPHNSRRWQAPEIVVFFPSGADEGVAAALRDMGVTVAVEQGSLSSLPVPRPPTTTNLDVTSLCALVSEVSWADPQSQHMQQWAARTTHWQECLAAQIASPLLPELHACLDDSQALVTSCAAVEQFQKLMNMFAGPREQQRWQELQQRMHVYHWSTGKGIAVCTCVVCGASLVVHRGDFVAAATGHLAAAEAGASVSLNEGRDRQCNLERKSEVDTLSSSFGPLGEQQQQQHMYTVSERVSRVDKLTQQQKAVLGLGDALEALTLTANGNAIRCCGHYGVELEAVVHRPVWLTGM